ncbi:Long-chain-alcohol dehydrogenase 1 [Rhodobacteraceae bacterium IMCC1933]|nr:Long-chain-alcohol dehydrogenase 1 [Rhodobacteraceae bacterium IMCC1923]MDP4065294.1 Long-chain-alcohol dehydrogenase 1 [Rhodobacteraceae bacterium IMCC1923]MDP4068647.1 Long-chain-alcohol dehydrogenase 1 [Rhodobacteraceae bacterium IMCC1933]MDP4069756.1 Long-chain-alcohol dehydrogenase 1 [Rhodobacteraceae bacterium IMCC1909]
MMNPFSFNTTPSLRMGAGLAGELGQITRPICGDRVLLVTDPGMMATGLVQQATDCLRAAGVEVTLFDQVQADPPEEIVLGAAQYARSATGVIGFGGGSSLDVAKLAALLAASNQPLAEAYGIGNAQGPRLPLVLVPTTAGTGSEVTPISIVTTGASEKMGVVSPLLLPDLALLDPELTLGLPAHVTAATGIDAMVHAIEAYASVNANNNPISRALAVEALGLMGRMLLRAVQKPDDLEARTGMLLGSMLAGQAFANSPVAAVHALAYPIGGHYKVPHGLSNALVLPHVLRFNAQVAPEAYAELLPHVFPDLPAMNVAEAAMKFAQGMADLSQACGLEQGLREMGIAREVLPKLARDAMNQTRLLVNNPRPVDEAAAMQIYEAAW